MYKRQLILCGDNISIWNFNKKTSAVDNKTENVTRKVSFDDGGMVGGLESGVMITNVEEKAQSPVQLAPTPDLLEPIHSDKRLVTNKL